MLPELIDEHGNRTKLNEIGKKQLMEVIKQSFLLHVEDPIILYNGTHYIQHLDKLMITPRHKKLLQENPVRIYFFEPLTHYSTEYNFIQSHTLKINNRPSEIEKIRAYELDSLQEWAVKHELPDVRVYCTDWKSWEHYQPLYPNLKLLSMDVFVAWWTQRYTFQETRQQFGNSASSWYHGNNDSSLITKKFWSGAWRYEPYRHFLSAFLIDRDIHLNGNVSFYFKISNNEMKRRMWFPWKEFNLRYPKLADSVLNGNTKLQDIVPLSFACEEVTALGEHGDDPNFSSENASKNIRTSQDPEETYFESFCAIVQESRFTQPWPNISEKTLNAIKNYRPFIMAGPPGTLKMLKEMGFKTFSAYWPEDYDDIVDNVDRIARICEIIDYINSFSIEELQEIHKDMHDILIHNKENLKNVVNYYNKLNNSLIEKIQ
jgi:hypothetical protein